MNLAVAGSESALRYVDVQPSLKGRMSGPSFQCMAHYH